MCPDGPKWAQENFFPTNPDLADILGKTDLDFEDVHVFLICLIPNFWISGFPDFQNMAWAGLGLAQDFWIVGDSSTSH